MTAVDDKEQRSTAIDPTRSFIVEAPAGSGKTELLIQRFFKLLARVEQPEQIIAITFTRKAAAEMRQRVIETLAAARAADAAVPEHRLSTVTLARELRTWDQRQGWQLDEHPSRLRITTIDALNQHIAQQMPLIAGGTGTLSVADDAGRQYTLATMRTTNNLGEVSQLGAALRRLLEAADNSLPRLETWLAELLPQRDRWLRALAVERSESLQAELTAKIERLADDRIAAVRRLVGSRLETALFDLLDEGIGHDWRRAAAVLLSRNGRWRQRFTSSDGFPAGDRARRQRLRDLLAELHSTDALEQALAALVQVPAEPAAAEQQELLTALEIVFPRLLAELRIVFEKEGCADHAEHALAAVQALGAADAPSELLLALDRRIEHILVDEFQDTSHLQWRLLELLTAGWMPGDGRTLFLVGDPMQSIYGFRDADLTLFLEAKRCGLGGFPLEPLRLSKNFRSAPAIVEWVDARFCGIFPPHAGDAEMSAGHSPSLAALPIDDDARVQLHLVADTDYSAETNRLIRIVRETRAELPDGSIGILVRSRAHLAGLRRELERAGFEAEAVEIDSLTDTQLGQDLITLTQALLHPGDRLAWLGVLRSPWCGLDWTDLLALCGDQPERSLRQCLADETKIERLSAPGQRRARWVRACLERAFSTRGGSPLSRWIRDTWLALDGPATLGDGTELSLAESYFAELDVLAHAADLDDPVALRDHFGKPMTGARPAGANAIEIMTIHRAKGLEFDTVILPGLSRTVRGNKNNLFFYKEFNLIDSSRISLLAAASQDPMADFLRREARAEEARERGRLLYVATTRARSRLHLIGTIESDSAKPKAGSLLATLWPALEAVPEIEITASAPPDSDQTFCHVALRSLSFSEAALPAIDAPALLDKDLRRPEFEWVHPASVQVGTLIHRELERLARAAARSGIPVPPRIAPERYRRELALLGVEPDDLDAAAERVAQALDAAWADPVGRWILRPWSEAWSELRISVMVGNRYEHLQLDRSFVDDSGERWIIDYKTGRHLGGDVDAFVDNEVARYRGQLEKYAAAVGAIDARPIRVGLYFPLLQRLCEMPLNDATEPP